MAINDKFQLTNYGSEVQKAIDDALINIPAEVALKAYRDEVLTKTQTTPYTPTQNYHPVTKIYADELSDAVNTRLDEEIERAIAAETVLGTRKILIYEDATYKDTNFNTLSDTQYLIEQTALEARLAELHLGFFKYYQVNPDTGELIEGRTETGVDPQEVVRTVGDLPATATVDNIALTLGTTPETIDVYRYDGAGWVLLHSPSISNGWMFAEQSSRDGYYWFAEKWHLVNMEIDMSLYYTKLETDAILTNYVQKVTLGDPTTLTTTHKTTIVGAVNEVNALAKTKDTLPTIPAYSVLANTTGVNGKPTSNYAVNSEPNPRSIIFRTDTGQAKVVAAVNDNEATTLSQVKDLIDGQDLSAYQLKIPAGTANNLMAYSGTAGTVNSLNRLTTINASSASRNNNNIPTEVAVGTYVDNYKPMIVTQGSASTTVSTNQLTFWIEQ